VTEPAVEPEDDEAEIILRHLIAERTDGRTKLAVHHVALLRMAALLMASGDTSKARDITDLLERAPSIVRPGAIPPPTLAQVCRDDAELDVTRLSNAQLVTLEELHAVMAGRACPLPSPRQEGCLALVWLLDEADGEPDASRVRELVSSILGSALVERVFPSNLAELSAERAKRQAIEADAMRMAAELERLNAPLPANVVRLRREAAAEAAAPIMHQGSGVQRLAEVTGAVRRGPVGDISSNW
jgi:hypothetical protein